MKKEVLIELLKGAMKYAYDEGCRDTESACQLRSEDAAEDLVKRYMEEADLSKFETVNPMQLSRSSGEGLVTIMSAEDAMTKGVGAVGKSLTES